MTKIFISYSRADGDVVDTVIAELAARGYGNVFAYDLPGKGTPLGVRWEPNMLAEARTCAVLVVLTGPRALASPRCTQEIAVALEPPTPAAAFEIVVAGASGSPLLRDRHRLVLTNPTQEVRALVLALGAAGFGPSQRAPRPTSPYPGLRAFDTGQAEFFRGRDLIVDRIVRRLDQSGLPGGVLPVVGPSGVGKSSIVRAGVIPRLRSGRNLIQPWFVCDPFTPGEKPLGALAARLADTAALVGSASPMRTDPNSIEAALAGDEPDHLLAELLSGPRPGRVLLVLDQAEELLSRSDQTEVATLTSALARIVADRRAWLLYTLRSDFLTDLLESVAATLLVEEPVLVPALGPAELSVVITGPATVLGWSYEPAAVATMLADSVGGQSLPLLAYTLDRLFREVSALDRGDRLITLTDYTASGRVQDVLTQQADIAFEDALARAAEHLGRPRGGLRPAAERQVLRLLRRLVTVRDGIPVRRALPLADLSATEQAILEPFVQQRVVSLTDRHAAEVTHEALLSHWSRLRDDIEELGEALQARADIERRSAEWEQANGPSPGTASVKDSLLPVTRLLAFLEMVRHRSDMHPPGSAGVSGWDALRVGLDDLDLGGREIDHVGRSLQAVLRDEVSRISRDVVAEPVRATTDLLGMQSDLQRDLMSALVAAPDTAPLVDLVHRAMAANPVHLIINAHENGAWGAAWSPDGTRFASGGRDQTVRVWRVGDGGSGPVLEMLHGMDAVSRSPTRGWVRSVSWTCDGRHILSVATDETLRIWDADQGGEIRSHVHPDRLWTVHTSAADGLAVTAGADGLVRVWPVDRRSRDPLAVLDAGGGRLWAAALSPDGTRAAAACEDRYAYVIDVADPTSGPLRLPHPDKVRSIAWSPDGSLIGTGCQDGIARVFQARTGELRHELTGHDSQVRTVRWSPGGLRIATGSEDLDVRVWDAVSGAPVALLRQHTQGVCALDWAPDGDRLLTAADDGTARVWKLGSEPTACVALDRPARGIAWHARTGQLAVATADNRRTGPGEVVVLPVDGSRAPQVTVQGPTPVLSVQWTADADLVTGSADGSVVRWRDGWPATHFTGARDSVVAAVPAPGGLLLGASRDRVIRLWDADGTLHPDGEPEWHTSFLEDADWDATGQRFAVVSQDHRLSVHRTDDRTYKMTDTGGALTAVAWNDVTSEIAVGRADGTVEVYGCEIGLEPEPRRELSLHSRPVTDLAWSPDGVLLCVAAEDSRASIWHTPSGTLRTVLVGHAKPVTGCTWTANRSVATVGEDAYVRLWDVHDADTRPVAGLPTSDGTAPHAPGYLERILDELGHRTSRRL